MPESRANQPVRKAAPACAEAPIACPRCGSRLVQLVDAEPHPPGGWDALLECPECWTTIDEHLEDDAMEDFDRGFDDGVRAVIAELRRMTVSNMLDDVERFAAALRADAILPEDF